MVIMIRPCLWLSQCVWPLPGSVGVGALEHDFPGEAVGCAVDSCKRSCVDVCMSCGLVFCCCWFTAMLILIIIVLLILFNKYLNALLKPHPHNWNGMGM